MQPHFQRILDNAPLVTVLLFAAGAALASIGLAEPAVIAFLACGMLLMVKASLAPRPDARPGPQG